MASLLLKSYDINILNIKPDRPEAIRQYIPLTRDPQNIVLDYCRPSVMVSDSKDAKDTVIVLHDYMILSIRIPKDGQNFMIALGHRVIIEGLFINCRFYIKFGEDKRSTTPSRNWILKFLDDDQVVLRRGMKKIYGQLPLED